MPDTTVQKMIGAIHLDELDEAVAERLDPVVGRKRRPQPADERTEHDGDQHLNVENLVPGFRCAPWRGGCDGCRHGSPHNSTAS